MTYQEILYQVADRVATITLNRPDKLNAWTDVMEKEVRAAMHEAEPTQCPRHHSHWRGPRILRGSRYVSP